MGGRRGGSAGRGAVVRRRWRGHVDGRAGLGLGCGRLLFNPREVDAATLRESKNKVVSVWFPVTWYRQLRSPRGHRHNDKFVFQLSDTKTQFIYVLALNFII